MAELRRYILRTFTKNYFLVFLPFFLIVSLVFIIQLSSLSSKINIAVGELIRFFGYMLPEIFFYTIPFSLIAALANTFSRFSEENELIALFSLGHSPRKILTALLPTLVLFSLLLLIISALLFPQMRQKARHFKHQKIAEATLNIVPNKLSQNFGDFHVFVSKQESNGTYENMVLFNKGNNGRHQLFIADRGIVRNDGKRFTLVLRRGTGETSTPEKIDALSFKELRFHQYPKAPYENFQTSFNYWREAIRNPKRKAMLYYVLFISLSPLLGFGILASMTFYNPRYRRAFSSLAILAVVLAVYLPAAVLQKNGNAPLFVFFLSSLIAANIFLLRRQVFRNF